ncbi:hypothetical protein T484DRAFT_2578317 [Baffinella frigidus]|nr:hypothetical protein T484DRAFT_2578317 [Cryptophyta sp. CCMP2293]
MNLASIGHLTGANSMAPHLSSCGVGEPYERDSCSGWGHVPRQAFDALYTRFEGALRLNGTFFAVRDLPLAPVALIGEAKYVVKSEKESLLAENRRLKKLVSCLSGFNISLCNSSHSANGSVGSAGTDRQVKINVNNSTFLSQNGTHKRLCTNGPYVWDRSPHLEGIGSTFQHRKPSLILAHALDASWIGMLKNQHDKGKFLVLGSKANHQSFFGLGADD